MSPERRKTNYKDTEKPDRSPSPRYRRSPSPSR